MRLLTPIKLGAEGRSAMQLFCGVNFHERVEVNEVGSIEQFQGIGIAHAGDDDQHRFGSSNGGFIDLMAVNREVLAQQRQRDRRCDAAEVVERAMEVLGLGQHGHGGGTPGFIEASERKRIGGALNGSCGRRVALELGNDGGGASQQRIAEARRMRRLAPLRRHRAWLHARRR